MKTFVKSLRHHLIPLYYKFITRKRRLFLKNKDFTIISNNCWGGTIYNYFGLPYNTPTVGLYFMADEYIKFIKSLEYYINLPLVFIKPEQSKYKEWLFKAKHTNVPIGVLGDVEIVFLHYKSEEEALTKWNRRKERINYDNLLVKFSDHNYCKSNHVYEFDKLDKYFFKLCFVGKEYDDVSSSIMYFKEFGERGQVFEDWITWKKHINITNYLNNMKNGWCETIGY